MTTSSTPAAGDSGALENQGASKAAKNPKGAAKKPSGKQAEKKDSLFARIALFVRQVISELRKVVTPSRNELITYTIVVLVFILIIMAYVGGLDYLFGRLVLWVFG